MVKKFRFDAGHGGEDGGAGGNGVQEKLFTLKIMNMVAEYLKNHYTGFEIGYSRTTDVFVSLSKRAEMANDWGADVFISFHNNSATSTAATGYEDFVYTGASSASKSLQNVLHDKVKPVLAKYGISNRGKKAANYAVLRETTMPAILVETLFVSNVKDASLLKQDSVLRDFAAAYAEGLAAYAGLAKKTTSGGSTGTSSVIGKLVVVTYTGSDGLNIRKEPDFDSEILTKVYEGEAFTIVEELEKFYKLKSGGYITKAAAYVRIK